MSAEQAFALQALATAVFGLFCALLAWRTERETRALLRALREYLKEDPRDP